MKKYKIKYPLKKILDVWYYKTNVYILIKRNKSEMGNDSFKYLIEKFDIETREWDWDVFKTQKEALKKYLFIQKKGIKWKIPYLK